MLGALARRLGKPLRVGTSTALLVGIVAAVASREMTSVVTVRVAPTARIADLAGARLTKLPVPSVGAATAVQAATLWQDRPAVVLVLRRPGWVLCRSEAAELHAQKASIEAKGARLVCLLKGKGMVTAEEVAGFRNGEYWGEDTDLFLDDDLVFFKTLGNGKLRKKNIVGSFLNPFSTMYKRYGKISDDIKNNANLVGEGLIMGGLFVVNRDAVVYQHKEKDFGTVAPIAEVLGAVDDAVQATKK